MAFRGTPSRKRAPRHAGAHGSGRRRHGGCHALAGAPAPQRIAARFKTCPRFAAPSAARQRCTRLRFASSGTTCGTRTTRLQTPSWRHGYRHSNTTCVQGCARTPPRPARCCPDALTPPVRENGRLPRALAPLHRPPGRTESSLFFGCHFFDARADRAAAAAATRGIRIRSRSAARPSGRSPSERTRAHPRLSGRARAALRNLSRVRSKNSIII